MIIETTRISADHENNAEAWWENAREAFVASDWSTEIGQLLHGREHHATVSSDEADRFEAWCESLDGFADGPAHAREALIFSPESGVDGAGEASDH
ncbi:MAG: hypothetical protein HC841_00490 [Verrucomicrobiae bacterium]|nr:hypothetical protein [Verrucomicrobiae bacterium]